MHAPVLSITDYRSLVAELPRPSPEQMESFAKFVSHSHSWYKHIPRLPPGVPFNFFIDPTAGLQRIVEPSGRCVTEEREETGFHYSWIPTRDYRNKFGFLAWSCEHIGTTVGLMGDRSVYSDRAPSVVEPNGTLSKISTEAVEAGTVHISGIVHTLSAINYWYNGPARIRKGHSWPEESGGQQVWDKILARFEAINEDRSLIERVPKDHEDWTKDGGHLSMVDLVLHELIVPERRRQQRAMVAAMERVCDLLFSTEGA